MQRIVSLFRFTPPTLVQALSRPPGLKEKMADNIADTKPLDCKIIIKNPVLLKIGDVGNDFRSGVSVIDIIFPGNNNVEVRLVKTVLRYLDHNIDVN